MNDVSSQLVELSESDAAELAELEQSCFIPPLQATAKTIRERFRLGHTMLGIRTGEQLQAAIAFCRYRLDPQDLSSLPATEREFCLLEHQEQGPALVIYNLEVRPDARGQFYAGALIRSAVQYAKDAGAIHGFANARMPSYAGSDPNHAQEAIPADRDFRRAIDRYLSGGRFPTHSELSHDPIFRLYHQLTHCEAIRLMCDFAPLDVASGGMRLLVYRNLTDFIVPL